MTDEILTIDNVPCQCEIYEICRKCAPTPEDYERAWQQREEVLSNAAHRVKVVKVAEHTLRLTSTRSRVRENVPAAALKETRWYEHRSMLNAPERRHQNRRRKMLAIAESMSNSTRWNKQRRRDVHSISWEGVSSRDTRICTNGG